MNEMPHAQNAELLTEQTDVGLHESELTPVAKLDYEWIQAARADMMAALAGTAIEKPKPKTEREIKSLTILGNGQKNFSNRMTFIQEQEMPPQQMAA